jgi:hypothetical protein
VDTRLTRRSFFTGLALLIAAPAIVRATSIMPVKAFRPEFVWVPGEALKQALGAANFDGLRYGNMFMLMTADADGLNVKTLSPHEVYKSGLAEWRFPNIAPGPRGFDYAEPPASWE